MSDPSSFLPDNDFVELLWENGPIVMQGQSNRQRKTSYIPSYNQKIQEEKDSRDQEITKIGQFNGMQSHFAPSVPCTNMGLSTQDDDIRNNPWMSYSFEDPLSSELFSELTGVDRNCRSNLDNGNASKINTVDNNNNKFLKMQHGQFQKYDVASNSKPLHGNNGSSLANFAHFSRPLSLAKATNESLDRCKAKEMEKAKGEMKAICHQDVSTSKCINDKITNNVLGENRVNVHSPSYGAEKSLEPIVGSSSVCSGNSAGAASNDPKTMEKRKSRGDESGYQSEDIDDESTGLKKSTTGKGGTSAKRSRAAEVHNLSERRRRDRINEKMRALQELIPNCNKVDKASMLDEAIEYLKTLQLQVQMMAMGSGLCMPHMMLAPGMQHMRAPTMAHFSPIGVGMGMGMGLNYPMGMLDMNGIPISPMHASQFPGFGISGHGKGMHVPLPQPSLFNPLSSLLPRGNLVNEVPLQVPEPGTSFRFNIQGQQQQQQQQQRVNLEATPKANNIGLQADIGHIRNGRNSTNNAGHYVDNAEKIE